MDEPIHEQAGTQQSPATRAGEMDILDILRIIWTRWVLVASCILLGLTAGVVYLNLVTQYYSTELKVMPSSGPMATTKGGLGSLSGLASLAGLGTLSNEGPTRFDVYLTMLTSRSVAVAVARDPAIMNEIFADERDQRSNSWHEPNSVTHQLVRSLRVFLGQNPPGWSPPSADRLQQHIEKSLEIARATPKDPLTYLVYYSKRRSFGPYFVSRLNEAADRLIREKNLTEARSYVAYLERRLPEVKIVEQRQALITILSDQEKAIMAASSGLPYAASMLEPPLASNDPVRPRILIVLVLSALAGLIAGVGIALLQSRGHR